MSLNGTNNTGSDENVFFLSRRDSLICAIYITVIGVISTFGNGSIIVLFAKARYLLKPVQNWLILNLAIADFSVSICGYPYVAASNYAGRWIFGDAICNFYAFATFWVSMVSFYMLAAVSVYRYIILCKPFYKKFLTRRNTAIVIVVSWVYGLVWPMMPFFGWGNYALETFGTSCTLDWTKQDGSNISMNIWTIIICFASPLVVMVFCYVKIFSEHLSKVPRSYNTDSSDHKRLVQLRLIIMSSLMTTGFVVAWGPYAIMSLISSFYKLPQSVTVVPTMFAKVAPCLNFLIYTLGNDRFRAALTKEFYCCSTQNTVAPNPEVLHPEHVFDDYHVSEEAAC